MNKLELDQAIADITKTLISNIIDDPKKIFGAQLLNAVNTSEAEFVTRFIRSKEKIAKNLQNKGLNVAADSPQVAKLIIEDRKTIKKLLKLAATIEISNRRKSTAAEDEKQQIEIIQKHGRYKVTKMFGWNDSTDVKTAQDNLLKIEQHKKMYAVQRAMRVKNKDNLLEYFTEFKADSEMVKAIHKAVTSQLSNMMKAGNFKPKANIIKIFGYNKEVHGGWADRLDGAYRHYAKHSANSDSIKKTTVINNVLSKKAMLLAKNKQNENNFNKIKSYINQQEKAKQIKINKVIAKHNNQVKKVLAKNSNNVWGLMDNLFAKAQQAVIGKKISKYQIAYVNLKHPTDMVEKLQVLYKNLKNNLKTIKAEYSLNKHLARNALLFKGDPIQKIVDFVARIDNHVTTLAKLNGKDYKSQRERRRLHAQMYLAERSALGQTLPKDFLGSTKNIGKLTSGQLYYYAYKAIDIMPSLGIPDIIGKNGKLNVSVNNRNNLKQAFLILNRAAKVAKEPQSQDFKEALDILINRICVQPQHELMVGIQLLPKTEQIDFLKASKKVNQKNKQQVVELNNKMWAKIDIFKYKQAKHSLNLILKKMGPVGDKIKHEDIVYNMLLENIVVMDELKQMQKRAEHYIATYSGRQRPIVEYMQSEITRIGKEITNLEKINIADMTKAVGILAVARDKLRWWQVAKIDVCHYGTRISYTVGGVGMGYYGGQAGQLVVGMPVLLPILGSGIGAKIGFEAGRLATEHSEANIISLISHKEYTRLKENQKILTSTNKSARANARDFFSRTAKVYIEAIQNEKRGTVVTIGNFMRNHKKLVIGITIGVGVALGVTMAFWVPVALSVGVGAGIISVVAGGGALVYTGVCAYIYRKFTESQERKLYNKVLKDMKESTKRIGLNIDKAKNVNPEVKELLQNINLHLKQQLKIVRARIKFKNPNGKIKTYTKGNKSEESLKEFTDAVAREVCCLKQMANLSQKINKILDNKSINKHEIKKLTDDYLDENYKFYHTAHIVENCVANKSKNKITQKKRFARQVQQGKKKRYANRGMPGRRKYINFKNKSILTKTKQDNNSEENNLVEGLKAIKKLANKL